MANRKKPFMILETKEEFDKLCDQMIKCGYANGVHDGRADALGVFIEAINSNFDPKEQMLAEYYIKDAKITKWRKEQEEREAKEEKELQKEISNLFMTKEP